MLFQIGAHFATQVLQRLLHLGIDGLCRYLQPGRHFGITQSLLLDQLPHLPTTGRKGLQRLLIDQEKLLILCLFFDARSVLTGMVGLRLGIVHEPLFAFPEVEGGIAHHHQGVAVEVVGPRHPVTVVPEVRQHVERHFLCPIVALQEVESGSEHAVVLLVEQLPERRFRILVLYLI